MELIKRVDTPDRREARIEHSMSTGLSREEAEFVDDTQVSIGDAIMSTLEDKVNEVLAKRPDLASLVFHDVVAAMETTFVQAHAEVHIMAVEAAMSGCDGSVH